jgi:membrane-bound lytic murein transglycosylase B
MAFFGFLSRKNLFFFKKIPYFLVFGFLVFLPVFSFGQSVVGERRAQLEKDLAVLEQQITEQQQILSQKQKESVSLERDISILNAKIKTAKLNIQARQIAITELNSDIADKEKTIGLLNGKLIKEKEALASIIRRTYEVNQYSLPEIVLSGKKVSEFFQDVDSFVAVKSAIRDSFDLITDSKTKTEIEKSDLEDKKQEQLELKSIQELEKKKIESQEAEKARILKISKGIEADYQKLLKVKKSDAAKIRAELFTLQGSAAIPFEKALQIANKAKDITGIRPAFLLGIIAEESNLGQNVGKGSWKVDMHPTRDAPIFLDICSRLGLNPDSMPVSKKVWYGYGGAMGPAQFIPSTWVLYEKKISAATGHNPPNPWDPEDAFMGAAIYLKDSGAAKQTVSAERTAALCYLAGCKNAKNKSYQFYADDVMDLADKYQKQIDILGGN